MVSIEPKLKRPDWLRAPAPVGGNYRQVKDLVERLKLHTVCESAACPNVGECWNHRTATFMILGNVCTRGCGFCAVPKGRPEKAAMPYDPDEAANVAEMARRMGLRHVVITSVNRDDLPDGGSAHFAATVRAVRRALPEAQVEVLTPDFRGDTDAVARVLDAGPHVFNHNMETIAPLYRKVRPQADYRQSLAVLAFAGRRAPGVLVKSGLMAGLGETEEQVCELMDDLRAAAVEVVTIGQYLQPSRRNMAVVEYVPPERYERWSEYGRRIGFKRVFAGPFVRSSYMADMVNHQARTL